MNTPSSKRPQGRPSRARPLILAAARELFISQGLDVSLDAVAAAAGTTRQTLYNHFASKSALLLEVFAQIKEELEQPLFETDIASLPLPTLLLQIATAIHGHFYTAPLIALHRLLVTALVQMPDLREQLEQRRPGRVLELLADTLARGDAEGSLHVPDPASAARAFMGAVMGPMYPSVLLGRALPTSDELQRLRTDACRTFLLAWAKPG